jgi:hypothetical protein
MSKSLGFVSILIAFTAFQAYRITQDSGLWIEVSPQSYGQCEKLAGPLGPEDITIDFAQKVAFISATDRRVADDSKTKAEGGIWLLDMGDSSSQPIQLSVELKGEFYPHGIDLLQLENGDRELYVVNHPGPGRDEILAFTVGADHGLTLKAQYSFPELISPNDIEAVSRDVFFVSNDHGSPRGSVMATLESYLGLSRSSIALFDGKRGHIVAEDLRMANGVALSKDQLTLYVAETTGRRLTRFARGENLKEWRRIDSLFVDSGVDNLEWDQQGRLLTGAHPKLFDFLGHSKSASNVSPSQVIRIDLEREPLSFETLYLNPGEELSGSSVAADLDGELLVGAVYEPHFLRCRK